MTERHVPALAGSETAAGAPPAGTASGSTASGSTASASASLTRSWAGENAALPAIELSGVVKEFQARGEVITAVAGIDLDIREGEFFSLLGPSGCGKTTTMRMIAGFEEPTQGVIRLHGQDVTNVPPNKRDVNMVFQSYALFPHMNVFENVAFGLRRKAVAKPEVTRRVGEMLDIVDMAGAASGAHASCPAASSSGWRSPGRSSTTPGRSCSTSPWARLTSSSARPCRSS